MARIVERSIPPYVAISCEHRHETSAEWFACEDKTRAATRNQPPTAIWTQAMGIWAESDGSVRVWTKEHLAHLVVQLWLEERIEEPCIKRSSPWLV